MIKIRINRNLNHNLILIHSSMCLVISGHSMEPLIPDGSYCLFKFGVAGSRNGRVVLVKKSGYEDPDTLASFTIKRYYS